jgi:hypothetical protein
VTSSLRLGLVRHYVLTRLITLTVPGPTYLMTKMFVVPNKKDIEKLKKNNGRTLFYKPQNVLIKSVTRRE